ncbi:hypothetical protein THOM_0746 [Trachipleistophora hominis]|uniref:Uncharacterized protein n=1 Tax=Trachipleistophora hominis TaxID=72359 RepID=L7JZ24_TRAHO|nr:hypothetical protein THOM_0746 [Trachipleistophora hominis]
MSYQIYKRKAFHSRMTKFRKLDILAKMSVKYNRSEDKMIQEYDNSTKYVERAVFERDEVNNAATLKKYNYDIRYLNDEHMTTKNMTLRNNKLVYEAFKVESRNSPALISQNRNEKDTELSCNANATEIDNERPDDNLYITNKPKKFGSNIVNRIYSAKQKRDDEIYYENAETQMDKIMRTQGFRTDEYSNNSGNIVSNPYYTHVLQEEYKMASLKISDTKYQHASQDVANDATNSDIQSNIYYNNKDIDNMNSEKDAVSFTEFPDSSLYTSSDNTNNTSLYYTDKRSKEQVFRLNHSTYEKNNEEGFIQDRKVVNRYPLCYLYSHGKNSNYMYANPDMPIESDNAARIKVLYPQSKHFQTDQDSEFLVHEFITGNKSKSRTVQELKTLYKNFKAKLRTCDYEEYKNLDYLISIIDELSERKKKSQKNTLSSHAKKVLHSECELRRRTAINLGLLAISDFVDKTVATKRNKKKIIFGALQLILKLKLENLDH